MIQQYFIHQHRQQQRNGNGSKRSQNSDPLGKNQLPFVPQHHALDIAPTQRSTEHLFRFCSHVAIEILLLFISPRKGPVRPGRAPSIVAHTSAPLALTDQAI